MWVYPAGAMSRVLVCDLGVKKNKKMTKKRWGSGAGGFVHESYSCTGYS
jgi:hypothetical protein